MEKRQINHKFKYELKRNLKKKIKKLILGLVIGKCSSISFVTIRYKSY
jgi:hypothetical protein